MTTQVMQKTRGRTVQADPNDAATFGMERERLQRIKRMEERIEKVEALVADLLLQVKGTIR